MIDLVFDFFEQHKLNALTPTRSFSKRTIYFQSWSVLAILTLVIFLTFSGLSHSKGTATLDQASDNWVDNEAGQSTDKILRDIEKSIKLDPDLKKNLKDSIKGLLKSKLKESFIPNPPSIAMESIIHGIRDSVNGKGRGRCQKAAAGIAWSTANGVKRGVLGGLHMAIDVFEAVLPGGKAAGILKKLEGQLAKELGKEAIGQLRKALEKALDDYLKNYKVETYSTSTTIGPCKTILRVIWNKSAGTFRYLIAGDCNCAKVSYRGRNKIQLSRWSVSGTGTAKWIGEKAEKANEKSLVPKSSMIGNPSVRAPKIKAVCCKDGKPLPGDPWTFVPEETKPKICIKVEIEPSDPRYVKALEFLKNNHPKTHLGKLKELKAAFDKAKCADKLKALEELHAFLQALQDKSKDFVRHPKFLKMFDKAIEETKKAIDEANAHMEDCGKKHCMLLDAFTPVPDGTYSVSRDPIYFTTVVSEREVCVGTTYTFSATEGFHETEEGTIYEPILISVPQPTEPTDEPTEPDEPTQPEEPKEPTKPLTEEPEEETPQPSETPQEEPVEPTEEVDLGLVKAQETVVELALSGDALQNALEGAVVKLFTDEPELPVTTADNDSQISQSDVELAMRDAGNFEADVVSGIVDTNGLVALSGSPQDSLFAEEEEEEIVETAEDELLEEEAEPDANAVEAATNVAENGSSAEQPKIRMQLGNAAPRKTMASIALKPDVQNPEQELDKMLLASGVHNAEIVNQYRIGNTPVYVIGFVPQSFSNAMTYLAKSNYTLFVEEDPCRNKEGEIDPLYSGAGLWQQAFDNQWAIKQVGFDREKKGAWSDLETDKLSPVTVAVIDTGLDWFHPDLPKSTLWNNEGEIPNNGLDDDGNGYTDDVIGWDFVRQTNKPWDRDGHGTFVSGVIGAAQNNGIGIAGIVPKVRLMTLKALDAFGQGHASMIAEAITYAADNGAQVINLSLGGRGLTKVEQLSVDHALKAGAVVVVAAGNSGAEVKDYGPAGIKGVITVAATDRQDRRAGFSNWGPAIDIAAPGVDVLSLRARRTDLLADIPGVKYEKGNGIVGEDRAYFRASGTSFAAPIVAGTAALILSRYPELEAAQVKRMILNSAKDIATVGIDNFTGYGLLDAAAAISADPDHFIESRISGVRAVKKNGKTYLRIKGVADASSFATATLYLGKGAMPKKWLRVKAPIKQATSPASLIDLPARVFKGTKQWAIRLITKDTEGKKREARFNLKLG